MPGVRRVGDIELDQDLTFERRQDRVQRMAWVVALGIIVAALLGVFGHGPLSRGYVSSADGTLSVRYERFARNQSPGHLRIEVRPSGIEAGYFTVGISRQYFERAKLRHIVPEPVISDISGEEMRFRFAVAGSPGTGVVRFEFEHEGIGPVAGGVSLHTGREPSRVKFTQFVYP